MESQNIAWLMVQNIVERKFSLPWRQNLFSMYCLKILFPLLACYLAMNVCWKIVLSDSTIIFHSSIKAILLKKIKTSKKLRSKKSILLVVMIMHLFIHFWDFKWYLCWCYHIWSSLGFFRSSGRMEMLDVDIKA